MFYVQNVFLSLASMVFLSSQGPTTNVRQAKLFSENEIGEFSGNPYYVVWEKSSIDSFING